jgi:hypothetical protein
MLFSLFNVLVFRVSIQDRSPVCVCQGMHTAYKLAVLFCK